MSTSQRKKRSTSAEPRLVIERTFSRPGTLFTVSSIGLVMVTIIWSIGMTPLSTAISIRGKLVSGKTDTGIVNARYTPMTASTMIRKITDFEFRVIQEDVAGWLNAAPGRCWACVSLFLLVVRLADVRLVGSRLVRARCAWF